MVRLRGYARCIVTVVRDGHHEGLTMGGRRISRGAFRKVLIVGSLAAALVASGGPAAAWKLVGAEHGLVGAYGMVDNTTHPANAGAVCHYVGSPTDYFRSMSIRHPVAWARDVSAHEDHQVVGWRAKLQRATSTGGPWSTIRVSREEKATAYDTATAVFHGRTLSWQSSNASLIYRALVVIKWYRSGSVEGHVVLRAEYYRYDAADANPDAVQQDYCPNVTD
jgi:hypothetical protein